VTVRGTVEHVNGPVITLVYFVLQTNDPEYMQIQEMIHDLLTWRKEILSRKITTEQMKDLKQKVAAKIDLGNAYVTVCPDSFDS